MNEQKTSRESSPVKAFLASPYRRWGLYLGVFVFLFLTDKLWCEYFVPFLDWIDGVDVVSWMSIRPFGNLYCTAVASALIFCIAPAKRRLIIPLILCVALTGGLATVLKDGVGRIRPKEAKKETIFAPVWLPSQVEKYDRVGSSMPSGHTTTAVANAYVLSSLFPAGRPVFYTLAVLVGLGRVENLDHFMSDVFLSLILGHYVCAFLFPRLTRFFEKRFPKKQNPSGATG